MDTNQIKRFVQEALGCVCQEEVFRSIEYRSGVRLSNFVTLSAVVVIGNRLLIYVTEAGSSGCVEEHLPVLVSAGKNERDKKGLNRFRLVIAADNPAAIQQISGKMFEELRGKDDKIHLHVVSKKEMNLFSRR